MSETKPENTKDTGAEFIGWYQVRIGAIGSTDACNEKAESRL